MNRPNSPYCSWTTVNPKARGRKPLTLFNNMQQVRAWLKRSDAQNARLHGITQQTAMRVTRSLVTGGRTTVNAQRLINKQLGL